MPKPRTFFACLLFVACLGAATPAWSKGAVSYRFDPVHSQVVFFVSHLGLSHGIGRVRVGSGSFRFDPNDWSSASVDVAVDLTTLDMGDAKWTDTVRSSQFLDVDKFPQARFRSRSVEQTGTGRGVIRGELALHGKTQPLDLQVTFNKAARDPYAFKDKVGFTATATLQRAAFGLERYQGVVGEDVELRIEVEGIQDAGASTTSPAAGTDDGIEEH